MKRVLFVGQAMPAVKRHPHHWPSLNVWLYSVGLTDKDIQENFMYTALVNYFPGYQEKGGHKVPTKEETEKEKVRLKKTIIDFNPDMLVTIGKLSLSYCLNQKIDKLDKNYIGNSFNVNPYGMLGKNIDVIPLPHPSGASTWIYKEGNKLLLQKALSILSKQLK
ncbi:MAG: uracil-DNA glycosylase family protein [Microgenomates group bacterium]